jgi:hypothetical protein
MIRFNGLSKIKILSSVFSGVLIFVCVSAVFSQSVPITNLEKRIVIEAILRNYEDENKDPFVLNENLPADYKPTIGTQTFNKVSRSELVEIQKQFRDFRLFEFGKFNRYGNQIRVFVTCTRYGALGTSGSTYLYKFRKVRGRWKFRSELTRFSMSAS